MISYLSGYSPSTLTTSKGSAGAGIFQCPNDYLVLTGGLRLCGERLNDGTVVANSAVNGPITGQWFNKYQSLSKLQLP
jgi:hypothetical protein